MSGSISLINTMQIEQGKLAGIDRDVDRLVGRLVRLELSWCVFPMSPSDQPLAGEAIRDA